MGIAGCAPRSPAVQLICVGALRAPHDQAGAEYERRVGHMTSFRVDEVAPQPLQRGELRARTREALHMRERLARNAWVVGWRQPGTSRNQARRLPRGWRAAWRRGGPWRSS